MDFLKLVTGLVPGRSLILKREKLGSSIDSVLPSAFVNVFACNFSFDLDGIVLYIMYASLRALFIQWVLLNEKKKDCLLVFIHALRETRLPVIDSLKLNCLFFQTT